MSSSMKGGGGANILSKSTVKIGDKNKYKSIILSERTMNNSSLEKILQETLDEINTINNEIESIILLTEQIEEKISNIFLANQKKSEKRKCLLQEPLSKDTKENKKISKIIKEIPKEIKYSKDELERLEETKDYYQEELNILKQRQLSLNKDHTIFQYTKILNNFRENSSALKLNNLSLSAENTKKLQQIVEENKENSYIPESLKDKIFLFKGEHNTGKNSVVKALGNELNRNIYTMRYNDYMDENGLLSLFLTLTTFLKEQKQQKKQQIDILQTFEKTLEIIDTREITQEILDNIGIIFSDENGNQIEFDVNKAEHRKYLKTLLLQSKNEQEKTIKSIKDSCILYIEDLDKIVNSSNSFYEKGNLLAPIKTVIEEIKVDNLDIILILQGESLGNNNSKIKSYIDEVIRFEKIEKKEDFQEKLNNVLEKYLKKYNIDITLSEFNIPKIPQEYSTIKFIDNLAKRITKTLLTRLVKNKNNKINQREIENIIEEEIQKQNSLKAKTGFTK